jgi:hypothetical protein
VPADELAVENANEIINRCQQNLVQTPSVSSTSTPAETEIVSTETPVPAP